MYYLYQISRSHVSSFFFFFNDTATTEIYTLSLHDALPISRKDSTGNKQREDPAAERKRCAEREEWRKRRDRKSTRLNSSHLVISYAVFCLKKKKKIIRKSNVRKITTHDKISQSST